MSISAKLTSKGQITLPIELRKALNLQPGDRISFRKTETGNYELVTKTHTLADLRGIIKLPGQPPSIEQIIEDVAEARQQMGEAALRPLKPVVKK